MVLTVEGQTSVQRPGWESPMTAATPPPNVPDIDDDDRPIGRILSRREVLALIGASGTAAFLAACTPGGGASSASPASSASAGANASAAATAIASAAVASALPACVVAPELTEGPYYVDVELERSDIRTNTADGVAAEGAPLTLDWIVSQVDGSACMPMEGVIVDVWHCDALGVYSDVRDPRFDTTGRRFLRGYQVTDATGFARFTTIYPGWYSGRAVHAHFKLRGTPGFGVRYDSPVGPIRFDIGFQLTRFEFGSRRDRGYEFHLSIGEAF